MLIGYSNSTLLKPKALYLKTKKSHYLNKIIRLKLEKYFLFLFRVK